MCVCVCVCVCVMLMRTRFKTDKEVTSNTTYSFSNYNIHAEYKPTIITVRIIVHKLFIIIIYMKLSIL